MQIHPEPGTVFCRLLQLLLGADVACVSALPFTAVGGSGVKTSVAPETLTRNINCDAIRDIIRTTQLSTTKYVKHSII